MNDTSKPRGHVWYTQEQMGEIITLAEAENSRGKANGIDALCESLGVQFD